MFGFLRKPSRAQSSSDVVLQVSLPEIASPTAAPDSGSHRERLLARQLTHLKICSHKKCERLASVGIQTAGDLYYGDIEAIATQLQIGQRGKRSLSRYRTAIKLSVSVEGMMPRDALVLVAIHRRSVASLSRQSATSLRRDLERFSLTSQGTKLIGQRGVPSLRRVKQWVSICQETMQRHEGRFSKSPTLGNQALTSPSIRASAA